MNKVRKAVQLEVLSQGEDGTYEVLITTPSVDRYQDRVKPLGARLDNYRRNPVVMWAHDYSTVPLGVSLGEAVDERGIISRFQFREPANEGDFVNVVRSAWDQGVLRTASIGFQPLRAEENEFGGLDFEEWELLEWSIVPIPANQDALRLAVKALGLSEDLLASAPPPTDITTKQATSGDATDQPDPAPSQPDDTALTPEQESRLAEALHELIANIKEVLT